VTALRHNVDAFFRHYLLAVQYFTRIPVRGELAGWVGFTPEMLRASAVHFPGIGWLVGMAACVSFAVVSLGLPDAPMTPLAAAVACTIATVLLTGAFHEDGLADLADGLGGSADRERALEIMKDSRLGSFGALALVLAIAAKVSLLAVLASRSPGAVLAALLAAHTVSRFWPLVVIHTLPHIGDSAGSKSKPLADSIGRRALLLAAAWCIVPVALMALVHGVAFMLGALLLSGIAMLLVRHWLTRRLQGFTGDGLGATQQVCEVAFYLGAAFGLQ
jgi:adenosylcobinamide-GDP ribazoletransferase